MSPTQRSLAYYRGIGWSCAITERWNQWAKIRQDLFGFIDLLAVKRGSSGALAVQATSGANHAARVAKIVSTPLAVTWLEAGNRIHVVSWSKKGPRGKRKLWEVRVQELTLEDFPALKPSVPFSAHLGSC